VGKSESSLNLEHAPLTPHRLRGLPFDQDVFNEALAELSAVLDVYEVILGKHKFLGGDVSSSPCANTYTPPALEWVLISPAVGQEYSLADLFHFGNAPRLAENGIDIMTSKGRPNRQVAQQPLEPLSG
jgi:glutathione S-transferase